MNVLKMGTMLAAACALGVSATASAKGNGKEKAMQVSPGQIAKNPDAFIGKTVKVRAEVDNVLGQQAIALDEDEAFAGPDVLVVMPKAPTQRIEDGKTLWVTGKVQRYDKQQLSQQIQGFDPSVIDEEMGRRAVIIAHEVKSADGKQTLMKAEAKDLKTPSSRQQPPADPMGGQDPMEEGQPPEPTRQPGGQQPQP
jgi:hypothetical protein